MSLQQHKLLVILNFSSKLSVVSKICNVDILSYQFLPFNLKASISLNIMLSHLDVKNNAVFYQRGNISYVLRIPNVYKDTLLKMFYFCNVLIKLP